jgi:hypothetical protein
MEKSISLLSETRRLLIEKYPTGGYTEFVEMGRRLGIHWRWLYRLRSGELQAPTSEHVQKVYEELSGKRLVA